MRAAHLSRTIKDGAWELYDWDVVTGRTVWRLEEDGKVHFRTDTPIAATLEDNLAARNAAQAGWSGDYHRVASIPMQLLYDKNLGLNEAIKQDDSAYFKKWLNDSDNMAFRTKDGTL